MCDKDLIGVKAYAPSYSSLCFILVEVSIACVGVGTS
jgi:hypothetical protein